MVSPTARSILTRPAIVRLVVGWGAVLGLLLAGPLLEPPTSAPLLVGALVLIIGVILLCAFGVVHEAEHLARRLGDPYGSLVLTLSIVLIEVVLISAVMLGPGEHATIARDSVMAVSMIILNAVIGLSLLAGGIKHGGLGHNRTGTSAYLGMLIVLSSLAFALPALIGKAGSYTRGQEIPIIVLTLGLYGFFLIRQMGRQADDFREVDPRVAPPAGAGPAAQRPRITAVIAEHRTEVGLRMGLLVVTVLPIVLLSHDMATLLDDGLGRVGAPVALSGILIAMIVFLPESITSVRAALNGEIQRVGNLCHGALVSTVGLTIPAVLVIGMLTGQSVALAETPVNLMLLGVTLLLSVSTFAAKQVTATHGAAHLVLFAVYGIAVFS
ncbi:calcium:proton antiporter [Paeniglutamicibacter psychrophenolicus]|uniref:Ca2+:H+ antiporter n=1 Tax=Paeniglutamicibacter psychrophenolicus TaxID=257454 RepID=A0ABS4WDJ8_9MICC|nr:Ca2+:H+ antiporter [Paeniglutamicibacter psychrophenolicus]